MDREKAKALLPIIQAFAEGKTVQTKNGARWINIDDRDDLNIESVAAYTDCFRVKPKTVYRPFKDAEECWQEMQKHQPFGWLKDKADGYKVTITKVNDDEKTDNMSINGNGSWDFQGIMHYYTFADRIPFGIKEE